MAVIPADTIDICEIGIRRGMVKLAWPTRLIAGQLRANGFSLSACAWIDNNVATFLANKDADIHP